MKEVPIYYVYIIKSENDNKYYTGISTDPWRRLKEHNACKAGTVSTKKRSGFKLIYYELHKSRIEARQREKFWKSGYGRELRDKYLTLRWL